MKKPLSILRDDFIKNLADVINKSSLPAFIITPILQTFLEEVKQIEKKQLNEDKIKYANYLKEAETKEVSNEGD